MSKEVDQRIVEMQFNNRDFETNARATLSTLDQLKQSLNFTGAVKGINEIDRAAKECDISFLGNAVDSVKLKFSALEVFAVTALSRIANAAINTGTRMVNALTLDPIMTGFKEYETQINAVQTILANTSMNGTTLEQVTAALDELNLYADQTIYNFTEMARNIGTFTAAGVELQPAVEAIKGIANLAALSGSNSEQASRAMYQLSQALAAGRVSLMDWNSVVNAGMGGKVFQEALMDTAEAMGIVVDRSISFRESISSTGGKESWLTSEVLLNTLRQFTGDLTDAQVAAMGFNEEQVKSIQQLAQTANEAATRVKTFTQLWDTLKESAQSGWTQTWELIIGDFEEARETLTQISDMVGGFISDSANARNEFVQTVMSSSWAQLSEKIQTAGLDIEDFQNRAWEMAKEYGLVTEELMENAGSFEKTLKNGWLNADIVSRTLEEYASSSKNAARDTEFFTRKLQEFQTIVKDIWEGDYEDQKDRVKALSEAGYEYADVEELVQKTLKGTKIAVDDLSYQQMKAIGFTEGQTQALYDLAKGARDASSPIGQLVDALSKQSGRELLLGSLYNTLKAIFTLLDTVGDAWNNVFQTDPRAVYGLLEGLNKFTSSLVLSSEASNDLRNALEGLFSILDIVREIAVESFNTIRLAIEQLIGPIDIDLLGALGDAGKAIVEFRQNLDISGEFDKINEKISEFISYIKSIDFSELTNGAFSIETIKSGFTDLVTILKEGAANGFANFDISKILGAGAIGGAGVGIYKLVQTIKGPIKELDDIFDSDEGPIANIKGSLAAVKDGLESFQKSIQANTIMTIAKALGILTLSIVGLSLLDYEKVNQSLASMAIMIVELFGAFTAFGTIVSSKGLKGSAGIGVLAASLVTISVALIALSGAVAILSRIDLAGLAKGLGGVGVMLAELSLFLNYTDFSGFGMLKGGGMIALATGLVILSVAVNRFAGLNLSELGKGLVALGVALAELSLYLNTTINASHVISTALGITILGGAMMIFTEVVSRFGKMNLEQLAKGLGALAVALLDIGLSMNLFPKGTIGIATGLVLVGASLNLIAGAASSMAGYNWEQIAKGLVSIGVSLGEIAIALNLMKGTLGGSAALLVAAGALAIITPIISALGNLSIEQIAKGLGTLAGALAIIGVAGALLTPAATGMLAVAGALAIMGAAVLMAGVGVAAFSTGLISLAAAAATGAAGITAAVAAIATGIAAGIPAIATALANGVTQFAVTIANGAGAILDAGVVLLTALAEAVKISIPTIVETVASLLVAILGIIHDYGPQIIDTVLKVLNDLIIGLANFIPTLVQSAIDLAVSFVNGLADGIRNNAPVVFAAVRNLLSSIVELLITGIQEIVSAIPLIGEDLAGALDGLKNTVRQTLAPESMEAYGTEATAGVANGLQNGSFMLSGVASGVGEAVKIGLQQGGGDTYAIGETQAANYASGITTGSASAQLAASSLTTSTLETVKSTEEEFTIAGQTLGTNLANGLSLSTETVQTAGVTLKDLSIGGIISSSIEFATAGLTMGTNYSDGLESTSDEASNAGSTVSKSAANGVEENVGAFRTAGDNAGRGFYNGIMSWADRAAEAAREMVRRAIEAAEDELDSHSPSRVFLELGKNTDEGYILGIRSMIGQVEKASSDMSVSAIDPIRETINSISDYLDSDIDSTPTIRPVLDLTGIDEGAKRIDAIFSSNQAMAINSSVRSRVSSNQNGANKNEPVVEQFSFTQNNYSPKALSRKEIYRQTKNQFAMAKGVVSRT